MYSMYSGVKSILPSFMKSATPGGEEFKCFYEKNYGKIQHITFRHGTFDENLDRSNKNERSMFLYIHVQNSNAKKIAQQVILNKKYGSLIVSQLP